MLPDDDDPAGSEPGNTDDDPSGGDDDPQMIPKAKMDSLLGKNRGLTSELAAVRETNANLQGQLDAGQKAPAQTRVYSAVELSQAVANGEITQPDADQIRDTQLENRIVAKVAETVATTTANQARVTTVQADMARYTEAYPDIRVAGTEMRNRVEEEFSYLTNLGHPADATTEVLAVRAVVGPTSRIGKIKKPTPLREVDEQGGSGGDNPPGDGDKKAKLSSDEKAYYTPMVGKGKMYSDWDAVHAEMKFSNSRMREKMQRLA